MFDMDPCHPTKPGSFASSISTLYLAVLHTKGTLSFPFFVDVVGLGGSS